MTENKFIDFVLNKKNTLEVQKYSHALNIYHRHFNRFVGKNPTILEIGINKGGSLEMWDFYFNGECNIYGVDIHNDCLLIPRKLNKNNIKVVLGDQANPDFWNTFIESTPKFDIIIDDGGHHAIQHKVTFESLYKRLTNDGIYVCEDLHTAYWKNFGGGYKEPNSFIEYTKNLIDDLNAYAIPGKDLTFRHQTNSIHFYESIVVIEKELNDKRNY
jgi:SAM-dependent methyltransferase